MPDEITRIVDKVEAHQRLHEPLYKRMDADWSLYRLDPFKPNANEGISQEDAYTDNQPRVDADKIINFIASAERVIRVENDNALTDQRETNNNAERVAIGFLRDAERRLLAAGRPDLQADLGLYSVVRGGYVAARALLRKRPNGDTYPDVWPIDPRHLSVEFGEDGPIWAANVFFRKRSQIRQKYPDFKFTDEREFGRDDDDSNENEKVIDYYWVATLKNGSTRYMNAVVIDNQWAKKPTNTFAEVFPVIIRLVGTNPGISSSGSGDDYEGSAEMPWIEDIGESFFAPNRDIYRFHNRSMTYRMHLTAKAVQGSKKLFSRMGDMELTGDPDEKGYEYNLSVEDQQDVQLMDIPQLTRDADILSQVTSTAGAKGGLTDLAHGGTAGHEASGRALTILRSAIGEKLNPYLSAVQSCINGVVEALLLQYATGRYRPVTVAGRTRDRQEFSREIAPEDIEGHGPVVVRLRAQLPEDSLEKWQIAQIASTPNAITQESLASSQFIRDEVLDMQDGDYETSRQYAMKARMSTPVMLLTTQYQAAVEQEDWETAEFLQTQIQRLLEQQEMEHMARMFAFMRQFGINPMAAAGSGMGGGGGRQNGGGSGFGGGENGQGTQRNPAGNLRPEVAPQSGTPFGQPNPAEAGRPQSRDEEDQRLAALGLERG